MATAPRARTAGAYLFEGAAEAVVFFAFFRISEHIVGALNLLKTFLGRCIVGGEVGMMFSCESPVCLLDVRFRCAAGNFENFVVIFFHGCAPAGNCASPAGRQRGSSDVL